MNRLLFCSVITFALVVTTNSLILECNYKVATFWSMSDVYSCLGQIIFVGDPYVITDVSTNHMAGRSHGDVKGFQLTNQIIPSGKIPRNINTFFPNVESIYFASTDLKQLSREDFYGFPRLILLSLFGNRIEEIGNGIFSRNLNLRYLSLHGNPIKNIAHNVFDHLTELNSLILYITTCNNKVVEKKAEIPLFLFELSVSCPPTYQMIREKLLLDVEVKTKIDEQVADRINPLTWSLAETNKKLESVDARVEELERERSELLKHKEVMEMKTNAFFQ